MLAWEGITSWSQEVMGQGMGLECQRPKEPGSSGPSKREGPHNSLHISLCLDGLGGS